jgi:hypothetical protein
MDSSRLKHSIISDHFIALPTLSEKLLSANEAFKTARKEQQTS